MNKENILLKLSYRKPMLITSGVVHRDDSLYAKCPRCNGNIERDYQAYCDVCGQCLDWSDLDNINIVNL